MKAVTALGASLLGVLVFACGTDNQNSVDPSHLPVAYECPRSLRPQAIAKEDMAGKKMVEKTLTLTFDSGPVDNVTPALEQYLASKQVRATFFITGGNLTGDEAQNVQTLDLLKTDGHLIGNRTQTDDDVTKLPAADFIKSVTDTDAFIKDRMPAEKLFFRPPYLSWNEAAATTLSGSDMKKYTGPVGWDFPLENGLGDDIGSDNECWDGDKKTAQECADLYLKQIRDKKTGIVLLHDTDPREIEMIKLIVEPLQSEGFKFVRLDELNLVPRSETYDQGGPDGTGGPQGGQGGVTSTSGGTEETPSNCSK